MIHNLKISVELYRELENNPLGLKHIAEQIETKIGTTPFTYISCRNLDEREESLTISSFTEEPRCFVVTVYREGRDDIGINNAMKKILELNDHIIFDTNNMEIGFDGEDFMYDCISAQVPINGFIRRSFLNSQS